MGDALELMARYRSRACRSPTPRGVLVGILTNRDLRFGEIHRSRCPRVMTSRDLVTAPVGTTLHEAQAILGRHKIEKLPIVDADGRLRA